MFAWFEGFNPKKQGMYTLNCICFECLITCLVVTSCIQYEKAAVMWNIGAVYSQMGASQSLWNQDGLRLASQYFLVSIILTLLITIHNNH